MTEDFVCSNCGTPNPEQAKFCMECGTRIKIEAGERRLVSVLFADLSGFTAYSERTDLEDVRALADEAAIGLSAIVHRHGGIVDKIIGDAVMAVFGAPTSNEDDPERAVKAGLQMQEFFGENAGRFARLQLSIGINTGEAMYGPVGSGGQYTVIGDTVNTASRIQSAASQEEVFVGAETYRATRGTVEYETCEPIIAKNKAEPVPVWRALRLKESKRARRAPAAPMVGRDLELDRLFELWRRSRTEQRPYLATIVGAAGVGKSRVVSEFIDRLGDKAIVYWGRCLSYGEGITYWPVIEILKEAAEILQKDDQETMSNKLGTFLEGLGSDDPDELRTMASAMANLISVPTTPRGTYRVTDISKGELHWGIRRVLQLLGEQKPQVVVFEDLHWAEPTLLELLEFILEGAEAPILIVNTARPEFTEGAPWLVSPKADRRLIELEPLTEEDSRKLLEEFFGEAGLEEEQMKPLLEAAAGNALFLEETIRFLADSGLLDDDGRPVLDKDGKIPIAGSLHSLIDSRLDRLPDYHRKLTQYASVVGQVFWSGAVGHIGEGNGQVESGLEDLSEREMVIAQPESSVEGQLQYAFLHILVRDVAYARLSKGKRAEFHARCADWIRSQPGGEDELVEITAYHLEQACLYATQVTRAKIDPPILEAVRALTRAGEKAESRQGTREADRFYERALEVIGPRMPETATELRLKRSRIVALMGDLKAASNRLSEVADAALTVDRSDIRCEALLTMGYLNVLAGNKAEALKQLTEAQELADRHEEPKLRVRASLETATYLEHLGGSPEAAAVELRKGISLAEECGNVSDETVGILRLGTLLLNSGDLPGAEEEFERAIDIAGRQGSLLNEARATFFLGKIKFYRSDRDEGERLVLQALEWLERVADRTISIQALGTLAVFALARDELEVAKERLKRALPLAREAGGWLLCEVYRYLTEAYAREADVTKAREAAGLAREHAGEDYLFGQAAACLAEGFVAAAEGKEEESRAKFGKALPLLEEQGFVLDLADARLAFAGVLSRFKDKAAAQTELQKAREAFATMGAEASVARTDARLAVEAAG